MNNQEEKQLTARNAALENELVEKKRQLEIEAALERVRSRSMAMHKSDELQEVIEIVFDQILKLGILADVANFIIFNQENNDINCWIASPTQKIHRSWHVPYINIYPLNAVLIEKENGNNSLTGSCSFEQKNKFFNWAFEHSDFKYFPDDRKEFVLKSKCWTICYAWVKYTGIQLSSYSRESFTENENEILKRFAKVFEQTYTRFLDLQKAEAQAREAKIEVALERTRTQSMIMQHSKELDDTLRVFHEQVQLLGINSAFSFLWLPDEEKDKHKFWAAWSEEKDSATIFKSKAIDYPLDRNEPATAQCLVDWKSGDLVFSYAVPSEGVRNYFAAWQELIAGVEKLTPQHFAGGLYYVEAFMKYGCFGVILENDLTADAKKILARFAIEFERAYTRFLDLQKAEAQAREAEIELGLERVRARAMAMHKSDELMEAGELLWHELKKLDIPSLSSGYVLMDDEEKIGWIYAPNPATGKIAEPLGCLHTETKEMLAVLASWKKQEILSVIEMDEQETIAHQTFIAERSFNLDGTISQWITAEHLIALSPKRLFLHNFNFKQGYLMIVGGDKLVQDQIEIMQRFTKVFQQTYTRFLDLQKAEAQAREAHIEAALEKVRSRSLSMHKTDELQEVVTVVLERMTDLNIELDTININIYKEGSKDLNLWTAAPRQKYAVPFHLPFFNHPFHTDIFTTKENELDFFTKTYTYEEKNSYFNYTFEHSDFKNVPEPKKKLIMEGRACTRSIAITKNAGIIIIRYSEKPFSESENEILKRFAKVFEQAYTRFLDLQKAEAQAREAQIETVLEKVRSRSLAMHKSDDLGEVVTVVFDKLGELGLEMDNKAAIIMTFPGDTKDSFQWITDPVKSYARCFKIPYVENLELLDFEESRKSSDIFFEKIYTREEKNPSLQYLFDFTDYKYLPDEIKSKMLESNCYSFSAVYSENSGIAIPDIKGRLLSAEDKEIIQRIARVFEQAYIRFLDLQKAEAQARESEIQLAMERVRARTMAMQKSDELAGVAGLLFKQVSDLGIAAWTTGFNIWSEDNNSYVDYITSPNGGFIEPYTVHTERAEALRDISNSRKSGVEFDVLYVEGEKIKQLYLALTRLDEKQYEIMLQDGISFPSHQYEHFVFGSKVSLMFITYEPVPEAHDIFKRFGRVFEQTYTRFLDLQKAEAQAREAIKASSLDRVRGEIASMRNANDLHRITPLVWRELTALGVPFFRCGVMIIHEQEQMVEFYLSTPDGKSLAALNLPFDTSDVTINPVINWRLQKVYTDHWDKEQFIANTKLLIEQGQIKTANTYQGGEEPPESITLQFVPFKQGMMYVGSAEPLTKLQVDLVQALAEAFSVAYARYEDFTKLEAAKAQVENTLSELKATQKQLIQSEKMASLGELTAGIAHEIQNPLNFVNNFSEVSKELLNEMSEAYEKGDMAEAKELMNDVIENLEKINHHGKRADAIVKGMLQHSRSSTNQKEPTDINSLADEYLRLSYHGLRAKDKKFNADFKTDFDEHIGRINIIPQDIGRVLLNLYNNAFYATNEKKKTASENYKPIVSIETKKINNKVVIKVSDNGNGIPQNIIDKIFQPFFTTKPTGQGTGLGLSLSYDIIKAHGGELKVESNEGLGTEFIIMIPAEE